MIPRTDNDRRRVAARATVRFLHFVQEAAAARREQRGLPHADCNVESSGRALAMAYLRLIGIDPETGEPVKP